MTNCKKNCSNCKAACLSFNLYYCNVHNEKRLASETCDLWKPSESVKFDVNPVEMLCAHCLNKKCTCCSSCNLPRPLCSCSNSKRNGFGFLFHKP